MKSTFTRNPWKAIAFLTVVISMFSCTACDPDLNLKPQVTIGTTQNVSQTAATLVASVIPNGDNVIVSFEYQANNSAWKSQTLSGKLSGDIAIKVTLDLSDLQPSTLYNFKVTAGSVTSSVSSFTTKGLTLAVIKIKSAENVKINTASLSASVIPNQDNTSISFEYRTLNATWISKSLGSTFSGSDSVKVNLDLSDLQFNTLYNFRVKVTNNAGEVLSDVIPFTTYAVSDYDGNLYHSVTIGKQTWLQENFRGTHYANGDPIANETNPDTWSTLTTGAYCWYNNDPELGKVYGGLYNWYVGADPRGLIIGWYTPTGYEQADLMNNFNDWLTAGLSVMESGNAHWVNTKYTATNSTGFTALPNGGLVLDEETQKSSFIALHASASFWSSTNRGATADATIIQSYNCGFGVGAVFNKNNAFSLRLLKN